MRAIQRVANSHASIYQTFPPKTSLASSNMGLWPASARYFAVDRPANPAKVTLQINKANTQLVVPSKFPNLQRKITFVKTLIMNFVRPAPAITTCNGLLGRSLFLKNEESCPASK